MDKRAMSEPVIQSLVARRIWDSRGRPTIEAEITLSDGAMGRGIAPAGASRGSREAIDKRDGGKRLGGFDVQNALQGIAAEISPALAGLDPFDQAAIDAKLIALDGSPNKARLGGNALTAVSLGVLHAAAASRGLPLWRYCLGDKPAIIPLPEIQIFGGGAHAGRRTDVQDFMVMAPRAKSFAEALEVTAEVYHAAGAIMAERGLLQGVADEGGWWPAFSTNEEALDTLMRAIERAGFAPGEEAAISLDIAASEFGQGGRYRLGLDQRELDRDALAEMLLQWCARYPILSIEDPFAEDDDQGFERFTAAVGDRVQVIGDDYLVTSASRVSRGGAAQKRQRGAHQGQPGGNGQRSQSGFRRRAPLGFRDHRLGALWRDGGHVDRSSRDRLERRATQGRLVRALRTDGEMERGAAHRGGAWLEGALRRPR